MRYIPAGRVVEGHLFEDGAAEIDGAGTLRAGIRRKAASKGEEVSAAARRFGANSNRIHGVERRGRVEPLRAAEDRDSAGHRVGGRARNPLIMAQLAAALEPAEVLPLSKLRIPEDAKEAYAFALLAYETWNRRTGNLPSATGAKKAVVLGKICWAEPVRSRAERLGRTGNTPSQRRPRKPKIR